MIGGFEDSGKCCSRSILKLITCKIQGFLSVNLRGQVINLRGQILESRTGDATLRVMCCAFVRLCVVRCVLLVCNVWVLACVLVCVCVLVLVCHADPPFLSPPLSPRVYVQNALRVYIQNVTPCVLGTTPARVTTCGRGSVPHHTARTHHDHNHIHNTTQQQHTTSRGERRQRKRDRERRQRKKTEKETRQERRE